MEKIINKIYVIIFLYSCWSIYDFYNIHTAEMAKLRADIPTAKLRIKKKKKERRQLDEYFSDIKEAKERIELVAKEVEKLQKQFPTESSDSKNMQIMKTISDSLNIKSLNLSPMGEEDKGFYFSKKYKVKALGTYLQFLVFLEKISESERLFNIRDIKLKKSKSAQRGRFQVIDGEMIIEAYRYNTSYRENRGIAEIEKKFGGKK